MRNEVSIRWRDQRGLLEQSPWHHVRVMKVPDTYLTLEKHAFPFQQPIGSICQMKERKREREREREIERPPCNRDDNELQSATS
jgi:hypothetical protein